MIGNTWNGIVSSTIFPACALDNSIRPTRFKSSNANMTSSLNVVEVLFRLAHSGRMPPTLEQIYSTTITVRGMTQFVRHSSPSLLSVCVDMINNYAEWRQIHKLPDSRYHRMYSLGARQTTTTWHIDDAYGCSMQPQHTLVLISKQYANVIGKKAREPVMQCTESKPFCWSIHLRFHSKRTWEMNRGETAKHKAPRLRMLTIKFHTTIEHFHTLHERGETIEYQMSRAALTSNGADMLGWKIGQVRRQKQAYHFR